MTESPPKLKPDERQWAYQRTDGRCWYCGVAVNVMRANMNPLTDIGKNFVATLIDKRGPKTKENIIATCLNCAVCRGQVETLNELRYMRMRQQFAPMLTQSAVRLLASHGRKVRFRYHFFYFEKQSMQETK